MAACSASLRPAHKRYLQHFLVGVQSNTPDLGNVVFLNYPNLFPESHVAGETIKLNGTIHLGEPSLNCGKLDLILQSTVLHHEQDDFSKGHFSKNIVGGFENENNIHGLGTESVSLSVKILASKSIAGKTIATKKLIKRL